MKNAINYYYNIYINDLVKSNDDYRFYLENNEYHLVQYARPYDDIKPLYKLNTIMISKGILVHEIILNIKNEIITIINDIPYILIKLCNINNSLVSINDLNYYQNMTNNINVDESLYRSNWVSLWSDKIDYYEYQISQLGKKYPILCDSLGYYIGLGENAISYLVYNMEKYKVDSRVIVSHKRVNINEGSFEFYNPLNFIVDSRIRDLCEYIKNSFFSSNFDMYQIKSYINFLNLNVYEYILLYSRLLFPTYYFDIYDEIINNDLDEENIMIIINKNGEYEHFLKEMYNFIVKEKNTFIEPIEWLQQRY